MPLDYIQDKDIAGNAAGSIIGGIKDGLVATGADFVSTIWNSTVGLVAENISTQDILTKVDKDALAFYNEHREGVEFASFLGGVIVPQAATIKLLGMVKNGASVLGKNNSLTGAVADVFSGTKAQALQADLRVLMENAKYDDKLYTTTMRRLYGAKIGENMIDAAVFEAATIFTLNAHPYMEDYMESPYKNFALWAMVGGGIGGGLGVIQARVAVNAAVGDVATEAMSKAGLSFDYVNQAMPRAAQIQVHEINLRNMSAVLAEPNSNPLVKNEIKKLYDQQVAAREELILNAASWLRPGEKNKPSEYLELKPAIEKLLAMPEMMGVDRIKIPNMKFIPKKAGEKLTLEIDMLEKPSKEILERIERLEQTIRIDTKSLNKTKDPIAQKGLQDAIDVHLEELKQLKETGSKHKTVFYRPSTGDIYDRNLAGASALAVDLKGYKVPQFTANDRSIYIAEQDSYIRTAARELPAAVQDSKYLEKLAAWNRLDLKEIQNIAIAPDDLTGLNGAVSRMLKDSDKVVLTDLKFNVTSNLPSYQQTQKFIKSGAAGVAATHTEDIKSVIDLNAVSFRQQRISPALQDALASWIHGEGVIAGEQMSIKEAESALGRGMDLYLTGAKALTGKEKEYGILAAELWEKGAKFRELMREHADAEGYVRLYRGSKEQLKHHRGIESYTPDYDIAGGFGSANLYKVHVDNIIGTVGNGKHQEYEILVTKPHHPRADDLSTENALDFTKSTQKVIVPGAGSTNVLDGVQLAQHYTRETERQIKDLIYGDSIMPGGSFSPEEIAARLNVTKEAVLLVGSGRKLDEIPNWRRYTEADKIASDYLNPKNRMLALQGNPNTVNPIKLAASLDDRFLAAAHQQFVGMITAKHKNPLADSLINFYSPLNDPLAAKEMHLMLDQLKQNIGEINNVLVKSPFWQSLDMALRNISDGPLITYIGKRVSEIQDEQLRRVIEPVSLAMKGLGQSRAALIEFNTVENKLLSIDGWKGWKRDVDDTGYGYVVQKVTRNGQTVEEPLRNADGSIFYIKTPEAINAIEGTFAASKELLGLHNLNRELRGQGRLNDLGIYFPAPNLNNKFFSYVVDNTGKQKTSILYANSAEDLATLENAYKSEIIANNPTMQIVNRGKNEKDFNNIHGYMEGEPYIQLANSQLKTAGSTAAAIPAGDARRITDILEGYQRQILSSMRKYNEMYLNDITQKLDAFSEINQRLYDAQPRRGFFREKGADAAMTVKNGLLGVSNLDQFTTWKSVNEFVDMVIVNTGQALDKTANTYRNSIGSEQHFEQLSRDLAEKGIKNPYENFQMYIASLEGAPSLNSKRVVAAANGLMGTTMLRFIELGHPLVNALSLPILTNGALMEGLPKTTLANGERITLPSRLMMDGVRFAYNPKGIELQKGWEKEGRIDQVIRQFSDLNGKLQIPATTKGAANELTGLVESMTNSPIMEMLSKPSDFVEKWTRSQTMLTGYLAAKHAYPGISDRGATIYATAFSDRAIGNYHAAQRPALFQGTFGAMLGLFQTYMVTYGQHIYRTIEHGQFKTLATTMAMQAGIFGTASWPGYEQLSKFIGEHMSNQNYDLTTGTYRAVGDPMAEVILYGLPSNLGPSLYTRGDISPRIPSQFGDLAIVNSTVGVYNAVSKMLGSVINQPGFEGKLQGMGEALSLQTLSRPIARASEIAVGESVTRKGQTVATSDDVWTFNGIFSRALSVRPLEEQVTRNALNLHSYYGAADHDNRQAAVNKLRIAIRAGKMDDELVDNVADYYIKHGGSNKGWNAVMNEIMTRTEEGTSYDLLRKLEPDSPLRRMLKDTF